MIPISPENFRAARRYDFPNHLFGITSCTTIELPTSRHLKREDHEQELRVDATRREASGDRASAVRGTGRSAAGILNRSTGCTDACHAHYSYAGSATHRKVVDQAVSRSV